jgi:cytochrome c553
MKKLTPLAALTVSVCLSSLAMADDVYDYGEYLSGECTTCHRLTGEYNGIPGIVGLEEADFIEALTDYASGERENQAMASVAKSLDKEMMEALARYFGAQEVADEEIEEQGAAEAEPENKD